NDQTDCIQFELFRIFLSCRHFYFPQLTSLPLTGVYKSIGPRQIRYEPGKDQTVVVMDDESNEYPVEQIPLGESDDGKKREVVESVLYFGILENHVILVQSQALKARDYERHIEWLVKQRTSVFPKDNALYLSDKPSDEARKKIEKLPVKKVTIGAELDATPVDSKEIQSSKSVKFRPYGKGFDILQAVLGENWRNSLRLEDSLDEANLKVSLEVTYFRKTTEKAHEVLDNIATAMRHAEPDDVKIELQGGTVLKGNELKMTGHINVDTYNGVADSNDLYAEMNEWLKARIQEGTVK
ncbi:MAG: hypothetical protein V3W04_01210, partial [Gammaproteobacteria bacterium]